MSSFLCNFFPSSFLYFKWDQIVGAEKYVLKNDWKWPKKRCRKEMFFCIINHIITILYKKLVFGSFSFEKIKHIYNLWFFNSRKKKLYTHTGKQQKGENAFVHWYLQRIKNNGTESISSWCFFFPTNWKQISLKRLLPFSNFGITGCNKKQV